jgi:hypothetical protein
VPGRPGSGGAGGLAAIALAARGLDLATVLAGEGEIDVLLHAPGRRDGRRPSLQRTRLGRPA